MKTMSRGAEWRANCRLTFRRTALEGFNRVEEDGMAVSRAKTQTSAASSLRRLISGRGIVVAPGVFSPIVAQLAERAGFEALYFSGGGFANLLGMPDLGVTTMTEVTEAARRVIYVSQLPLIVDVDTGFGEAV